MGGPAGSRSGKVRLYTDYHTYQSFFITKAFLKLLLMLPWTATKLNSGAFSINHLSENVTHQPSHQCPFMQLLQLTALFEFL